MSCNNIFNPFFIRILFDRSASDNDFGVFIESAFFPLGAFFLGWFHLCLEISVSLGTIKAVVNNNNTFYHNHSFVNKEFDFKVIVGNLY